MEARFLVATQLSSLFPSQTITIPIQTARRNIPLPQNSKDSDPLAEHATYASILSTQLTGTILLRVLHGGMIIELTSLSTEVSPIRFVFPAAVLPSPAIFLWESSELHILAVTDIGSVYRLVLPLGGSRDLWQNRVDDIWPREYFVKHLSESFSGLVHVQGTHCIAISLSNGVLLRLETEFMGHEGSDDNWTETLFQHGSFLSSLTSFLPAIGSSTSGASEIVSMATHPWPTDIGHIWTLSRDRTLRLWKAKIGCVASKRLASLTTPRELSPAPRTSNGTSPIVLLDIERQTLLRVFSTPDNEDHVYVLAFIPTVSSTASGGSFQLIDTFSDQFYEIGTIECSTNSAHCHLQDFMVIGKSLYALWDCQGQSVVEKTVINTDNSNGRDLGPPIWTSALYADGPELTPAYLEELLLSPESLTDRFFEAIMRPGMFSTLTLRTAIDQYTDACLSLPGPPPPQLTTIYATVAENIAAVVGCTVNLNRDPNTGALQHANYWNALKRDWEGFIARCREVERSARWPLALGVQDQGEIVIVERERVGALVAEDLPLHLRRLLGQGHPSVDSQYDILGVLWTLRSKLGPQVILNLESRLIDIMHQEIAFSFADILQDQARRFNFRQAIDGASTNWFIGRLQSIDDIDKATRTILDVIGGFDMEIKREEDEVELLLPPPNSDWSRALATAYISTTIHARYDLCFSLIILLFFLADELSQWDPSLLAEVFAVFRGVAMLRLVSGHPAGDPHDSQAHESTPDDVVSRMRNMNVSRSKSNFTPTYSLIHRLLAQSGDTHGLPGAAHRFLDSTGLLQSISPAHATKFEVLFCERLRLLGFHYATWELISWLPRTPGVTYVLARLWLNMGRADDAAYLLEKLAGSFGPDNALSYEDQEALTAVLPATELYDSEFAFYVHTSTLFKACLLVRHEVSFSQLALSVVSQGVDTTALWHTVIKGFIDLGLYGDAYASLIASPHEKQKRECVSLLTYRMCEDNAVDTLVTFNFAGIDNEVEDALSFKARNVDPRVRPCYSKILYSWYIYRGDYRNAALVMYQRARKLQGTPFESSHSSFAGDQLEAYMLCINALNLVEDKNMWIVLPVSNDMSEAPRKRRKLSKHIPETMFSSGCFDTEIVQLSDIQYEYALLSAQIDIVRRDPTIISAKDFSLPASSIVLRLAQANLFNMAMATACSLAIDMTDLFIHLTGQCLRLSRNPDSVMGDTSDWLLTDKVSSWPGSTAERGWRYLRQSLERYDSAETDCRYTKVVLETIMDFDRSSSPPPWLIKTLEDNHHEFLIRLSLKYEQFDQAIEHIMTLMRKSDARVARDSPKNAFSTWLPYTLIDQVLAAASTQDFPPSRLAELRSEINNRMKRMQRLSQLPR
ncbi:nucleoporin Nup120/160-domain-containing protein [Infundibulicybe gibba]|nr:nucleoporin Nup120/160-domain-containing protein [Infundibulicybe gibba]